MINLIKDFNDVNKEKIRYFLGVDSDEELIAEAHQEGVDIGKNIKTQLKRSYKYYAKQYNDMEKYFRKQEKKINIDNNKKIDTKKKGQSQKHGFDFENDVRNKVFGLEEKNNNTDVHDIDKKYNKFNSDENISIKTTQSNVIYCGDILRFYNYDFNEKNTIIIIVYQQKDKIKEIKNIYEVNYTKELHKILFGNCPLDELLMYVKFIKSIPSGKIDKEIKTQYKIMKKNIQNNFNMKIQINPKVDSKNQRRVQCSIPNFDILLQNFITYKSCNENPNIIRNVIINKSINSQERVRNQSII